jgi:MoaA/NifB/PqqE/SkfB family radical SAM enzyme
VGREKRQQWEYRILRPSREATKKELENPVDELNELGADGWELVETIEYVEGGTKFLVLKRPAREEATGDDD